MSSIGAVFDLDGVLIDSHDQHQRSWFILAEELGQPLTEDQFKESFGMRNEQVIPQVFRWTAPEDAGRIRELGERKEVIYRELLRSEGIDPLPGVIDFLRDLQETGIPRVVGSSTSRLNIEVCLEMTGLDAWFGGVFAGAEDVTRGKPEPDVFLEAARRIDRSPAECFVVEDAHVGVEAARRAGMKVVAVTTTHAAETFVGEFPPDLICDSLAELSVARLAPWFEGS